MALATRFVTPPEIPGAVPSEIVFPFTTIGVPTAPPVTPLHRTVMKIGFPVVL
jgi:hypothetical protein